jgi:hypothetical protein
MHTSYADSQLIIIIILLLMHVQIVCTRLSFHERECGFKAIYRYTPTEEQFEYPPPPPKISISIAHFPAFKCGPQKPEHNPRKSDLVSHSRRTKQLDKKFAKLAQLPFYAEFWWKRTSSLQSFTQDKN